jgi:hypothetical protein
MKKRVIIALALFSSIAGFSQEKKETSEKNVKAPEAAKAAFMKAYPSASKVKWEKEGQDFEVNFMQGKKEMSAVYNASGVLQETEEEINVKELPASVQDYVKAHYKGSISEATKITKSNGDINYEAEVNKVDVVFDKEGKFIKTEKD